MTAPPAAFPGIHHRAKYGRFAVMTLRWPFPYRRAGNMSGQG